MAAIFASLATILASFHLPSQLPSALSGGPVHRDKHHNHKHCKVCIESGKETQSTCVVAVTGSAVLPVVAGALTLATASEPVLHSPETSERLELAVGQETSILRNVHPKVARAPASASAGRRVSFNLPANTVHEITPYAEVYNGVHPRNFHFGRGLPAPGPCFYDPQLLPHPVCTLDGLKIGDSDGEEDSSDDEAGDDDVRLKLSSFLNPVDRIRSLPWPILYTLVLACVMVRAFGAELLYDILESERVLAVKLQ